MSSVEPYEIEHLQEQIYNLIDDIRDLQSKVEELQMENTLLKQDLTIIKNEGCWRFVENPNHLHKSPDKPISGDV
jgi:FtsZ-binding cell division protein ZapB